MYLLHYVTHLNNKFCTALENGNGCSFTCLTNKICVFSKKWQKNTVQSKIALPINFLFLSARSSNEAALPLYNPNATNTELYIYTNFLLHM
jgi:hypothetical protein